MRVLSRSAEYLNCVADGDLSRLDHAKVDAAEIQVAKLAHGDEPQRPVAESLAELPAAVVRQRRHLERCGTGPQHGTGRQVRLGQVELEEQLVAEERERLPVGNQVGHVELHDRELRLGRWTPLPAPRVARHAGIGCHRNAIQGFAHAAAMPRHQQAHAADVSRRRRQRPQPRFEHIEREERGQLAFGLGVDYAFHSAIAERVTKNP